MANNTIHPTRTVNVRARGYEAALIKVGNELGLTGCFTESKDLRISNRRSFAAVTFAWTAQVTHEEDGSYTVAIVMVAPVDEEPEQATDPEDPASKQATDPEEQEDPAEPAQSQPSRPIRGNYGMASHGALAPAPVTNRRMAPQGANARETSTGTCTMAKGRRLSMAEVLQRLLEIGRRARTGDIGAAP